MRTETDQASDGLNGDADLVTNNSYDSEGRLTSSSTATTGLVAATIVLIYHYSDGRLSGYTADTDFEDNSFVPDSTIEAVYSYNGSEQQPFKLILSAEDSVVSETTYEYNDFGRVHSETISTSGLVSTTSTTTHTYDANGKIQSSAISSGMLGVISTSSYEFENGTCTPLTDFYDLYGYCF